MIPLKSIVAVILLYCVLAVLAISDKEHRRHGKGHRHSDAHQNAPNDSQLNHKSHAKHRSSKHRTAAGAPRENVPSPLQDFVLVSGSPLFHERARASDTKTNATAQVTAQEENAAYPSQTESELPHQEQNQPSGVVSEQKQENVASQQQTNIALKHPKEFAKAGLNAGENQGKVVNSGATNEPILKESLQGQKNPTSETEIGVNTPINPIAKNEKNVYENKATNASTETAKNAPVVNHANNIATGVNPAAQNPVFPFNTPGIRNYGKEKTGNNASEPNKQLTDNQNLGPNCHWKTTAGDNGEKITSLSCSGEFKRPINGTAGMENVGKIPISGDNSAIKEAPHENTLTTETPKDEGKPIEQSDKEFEDEAVTFANGLRKIHLAPPIKLNPELNREAKEYAERIASMGSLQHDLDVIKHLDEGENLAMGCKQYGVPLTAREAIRNWYNEVCEYDFDRGDFSMATGHFTQVVWADSKEFGIGKAMGEQHGMPCIFVVGRFKPSGNYKGEYKKNVFKGSFDPSYCLALNDKKILSEE